MAEVNANSLPAKTDLGTNDSAIVVDQTTNAGALVDLDVLADKVLDRITSKTFTNQVGGSSAATLLAQLSTLNSNKIESVVEVHTDVNLTGPTFTITPPSGYSTSNSIVFCQQIYTSTSSTQALTMVQWNSYFRYVYFKKADGTAWDASVPLSFALMFVKLS